MMLDNPTSKNSALGAKAPSTELPNKNNGNNRNVDSRKKYEGP